MTQALTTYTTFDETMSLGDLLAKSGFFPDSRTAAQAVVKVLAGRDVRIEIPPLSAEEEGGLAGDAATRRRTLNRLLSPGPAKEFESTRETYGDLSALGTPDYFYGLKPGEEHVAEIDPRMDEGRTHRQRRLL